MIVDGAARREYELEKSSPMDDANHSDLRTKLADLVERIDRRSREFREHGEFSNVRGETMNHVRM